MSGIVPTVIASSARLEQIVEQFEAAWQSGRRPRLDDFLPADSNRYAVLIELVHADLELRWRSGEPAAAAEYLERYPELAGDERAVCELLSCERLLREKKGRNAFTGQALPAPFGRFELLEEVGRGSTGVVFRALDPQLERVVAIKLPRAGGEAPEQEARRFLREARHAARLKHPGIATVYEVGRSDGASYLVREFIEGATLATRMQQRRPGRSEAIELLARAAEALQCAHGQGILHRDIKPSNILLDAAGRPYLIDFGLARRLTGDPTLTADGQLLGTPAYMSPEQARGDGRRLDPRTDVYSLGVVLYELLTGERPFRGSLRMLLNQILDEDPRPPRRLDDTIPRDLETICLKAMSKEPARRYTTAGAMAADLRRWQQGEPICARPVRAPERALAWARRRPAIAALLALVGLVGALGFGAVTWQWQRAEASRSLADVKARAEKTAREQLEANVYYYLIALAERELAQDNVGRAEQLLNRCAPALRGWEWHYLKRFASSPPPKLAAHTDRVYGAAFHPGGRQLATGGNDGLVKIWDVPRAKLVRALAGHSSPVHCVAYDRAGLRLASAGDQTARIWDPDTGAERLVFRGHTALVWSVALSPDGRWAASGGDDMVIRVWDTATGQQRFALAGHKDRVYAVAISPDGQRIASGGRDATIRLWHAQTGAELLTLSPAPNPEIQAIAFSPDGRWLASNAGRNGMRIWDAATGRALRSFEGHLATVGAAAYSPDGRRLATASWDGSVKIWDVATGQESLTLRGHGSDPVHSISFSADGHWLASGDFRGNVLLWNGTPLDERQAAGTGRVVHTSPDSVWDLAFSADGARLATASGGSEIVKLWDVQRRAKAQVLRGFTRGASGVSFGPGDRLAASSHDGSAKVWNTSSGQELLTLRGHASPLTDIAYRSDGRMIATSSQDYTVRFWDAATGRELRAFRAHGNYWTNRLEFSPDGTKLATAGGDGTVKLWDVASGQELHALRGHGAAAWRVAFDPGSRLLASAGSDKTIRVWDVATGEQRLALEGHTQICEGVAFSPDGRLLASASRDRTVKLWDVPTGHEQATLRGHLDAVFCVAFSPDGHHLASGSRDQTIRIWAVSTAGK